MLKNQLVAILASDLRSAVMILRFSNKGMKRLETCMLIVAIATVLAVSISLNRSQETPVQLASSSAQEQDFSSYDRFVVLADWDNEAVFDRQTGLVWERTANLYFGSWAGAKKRCENLSLGKHSGWRLPNIFELASLVDPNVPSPGPTLPHGHPFSVMPRFYWSATTDIENTANAWGIGFNIGDVGSGSKTAIDYVWCVRDGDGLQMTPL